MIIKNSRIGKNLKEILGIIIVIVLYFLITPFILEVIGVSMKYGIEDTQPIKEYFYTNGNVFRKESYDNITKMEITEYFSKDGNLIAEIKNSRTTNEKIIYDLYSKKYLTLKNGKYYYKNKLYRAKIKFYYDAGSIEEEFDTLGRINGSRKVFDVEGNLLEESSWQNGSPIGIRKMYYKNGKLMCEGDSAYYNYEGMVKFYYESGELYREENYKNGIIHGERTIYSKTGEVIEQILYKDGNRIK